MSNLPPEFRLLKLSMDVGFALGRGDIAEAERIAGITRHDEVRSPHVERVRKEIEAGTYETPEKHDIAAGRLLDEMEQETA